MAQKGEETDSEVVPMEENREQMPEDDQEAELPDEEQLQRILQCKRLSEGCNRFNMPAYLARKNSLHSLMMQENPNGGLLPPVTEGVPMNVSPANKNCTKQQSCEPNSETGSTSGSSRSSGSIGNRLINKRHSQEGETSCSSSISLDGKGSPTGLLHCGRRRSSTVSQCSSVLSEGTRQQLNFDLSPDLPPDSSILEANCLCGPVDFEPDDELAMERPASPEPLSLGQTREDSLDEVRPVSRLGPDHFSSLEADEEAVQDDELHRHSSEGPLKGCSPDSMLGDSHRDDDDEPVRKRLDYITREVRMVKVTGANQLAALEKSDSQETGLVVSNC